MKNIIKISALILSVVIMLLALVSCHETTTGQKYIEQKPVIAFTSDNVMRVMLVNKGNKVTDLLEGKASIVKMSFESLDDDVQVCLLDDVYMKKEDAEKNNNDIVFVAPVVQEEVNYPINNFVDVYYKDAYAMIFDIDLSSILDGKASFAKEDKFVKLVVELRKGYEDKIQIPAKYEFYLELFDGKFTSESVMTKATATFIRAKGEYVNINVFTDHKFSDLAGYVIDEEEKLSGLTTEWFLYGEKFIENIMEYNFPKEDLADDLNTFSFKLEGEKVCEHSELELITEIPATTESCGLKAHYYCDKCEKFFDEDMNEVSYKSLIIPIIEEEPIATDTDITPTETDIDDPEATETDLPTETDIEEPIATGTDLEPIATPTDIEEPVATNTDLEPESEEPISTNTDLEPEEPTETTEEVSSSGTVTE